MSGASDVTTTTRPAWGSAAAVSLIVLALAFAARRWIVEPQAIGFACQAGGLWWCPGRAALIATFAHGGLGVASLGAGIASFVTRRAWVAVAAVARGLAALVLYNYEFGAAGTLLGTLRFARLARGPAGGQRAQLGP